jgi:hypothetical protein
MPPPASVFKDESVLVRYENPQLLSQKEVRLSPAPLCRRRPTLTPWSSTPPPLCASAAHRPMWSGRGCRGGQAGPRTTRRKTALR